MEIADIFVVNKSDREDADQTVQELFSMITMNETIDGWRPRVVKTVATTGDGITALAEAINQHAQHIHKVGHVKGEDSDALRSEILDAAKRYFEEIMLEELASSKKFTKLFTQVNARKLDPYTAGRLLAEGKK